MALKIFDKLKPQGNYPAVDAADVEMGENFENKRLDEVMAEAGEALNGMGEALNGMAEQMETFGQVSQYVPMIYTAKAGQVIAVKEVDENGKPTAWETVDNGSDDAADAASVVAFDLVALGLSTMNADTAEAVTLETDTTEIAAAMENNFVQFVIDCSYRGLQVSNLKVTVPPGSGCGVTGGAGVTIFFFITVAEGKITASAKLYTTSHGLPIVTTDDNGKILQVVDGAWATVAVAESAVATYVESYINDALGGEY